jgi:hypothetical protein
MELSEYESRVAPDRYREVKINCEMCGTERWVRWVRVKKGQGRFCSRKCANDFQLSEGMKTRGKEFAHPWYDETQGIMLALWKDLDGVSRNTTYAHWLWERTYGDVPERHQIRWRDGNQKNCVVENLELVTPKMISEKFSKLLMGHSVSDETRKKISVAHTGASHWDGFVYDERYPKLSKHQKQYIRERDGFICQTCNKDLHGSNNMSRVHHIDGDKTNQDPSNLILVCRSCHSAIHCKKPVNEKILAFRSQLG